MTYRLSVNTGNTFGPFFGDSFYTPPPASSFTIEESSLVSSKSDVAGGVLFSTLATPGVNFSLFLINTPTPPFTLKVCLVIMPTFSIESGYDNIVGVCLKHPNNSIFAFNNYRRNEVSTYGYGPSSQKYITLNNITSISGGWADSIANQSVMGNPYLWLSITDPGSGNITASIGQDSRYMNSFTLDSRTSLDPNGPNKMGIIMQHNGTFTGTFNVFLQSWQVL